MVGLSVDDIAEMQLDARVKIRELAPSSFVFDDKALLKCFYCERYGHNHCCPPNIPHLDYRNMVLRCRHAVLVFYEESIVGDTVSHEERKHSSSAIHKIILALEDKLWNHNQPLAVSFIGGSCKICGMRGQGCPVENCGRSDLRRIPLEGIGVDVSATAAKVGVEVVYPPVDHFYRIGAVLW
jgi:predicted metal-binding protein